MPKKKVNILDKSIPHSMEAENYVIGSLLIDGGLANEFCSRLSDDDFFDERNKIIYRAIDQLYRIKRDVTLINTIEELKKEDTYQDDFEQYLIDLMESVPTVVTTESYVNVLKDKSLERELYYTMQDLSHDIINGEEDLSDLLAKTEKNVMTIVNKQRTGDLTLINNLVPKVFDIIDTNRRTSVDGIIGLNTGYKKLNEFTFGFQPGELIILAARPGIGKSALALNIAYKMTKDYQKHVAFFSLEMGIDQLIMRLLSASSNVKLSNIRSGKMSSDEMTKLLNARTEIDDLYFYIDETTTNNMEDIKIKCRKLHRNGKLDFIIVDYLQLLAAGTGRNKMSRYEEVTSLSRSLKLLARELNVPVLALSQLSRNVEQRKSQDQNKETTSAAKPQLSDLRESGSIEQDADIVLFLHRDKVNDDPSKRPSSFKVECIIAKNRQGMTGSFNLIFRGDKASFEESDSKVTED